MTDTTTPEGRTSCTFCDANLLGPDADGDMRIFLHSRFSDGNLLCTGCLRMICDEVLFEAGHTPADKEAMLSPNIALIYPGAFGPT